MPASSKAQEPSMEEILASIRRIIADDEMPLVPPPVQQAQAADGRASLRPDVEPAAPRQSQQVYSHPLHARSAQQAASDRAEAGYAGRGESFAREPAADDWRMRPRLAAEEARALHQRSVEGRYEAPSTQMRPEIRQMDTRGDDGRTEGREDGGWRGAEGRPAAPAADAARHDPVGELDDRRAEERWRSSVPPSREPAASLQRERAAAPRAPATLTNIGPMKPPGAPVALAPAHEPARLRDEDEAADRAPAAPAFSSPPAPAVVRDPAPRDVAPAAPVGRRNLLSPSVDAAVAAAFQSLGDLVLPQQDRTVEDLVKEILRPMLKEWLDQNLPQIVERLVRAEIERVARTAR